MTSWQPVSPSSLSDSICLAPNSFSFLYFRRGAPWCVTLCRLRYHLFLTILPHCSQRTSPPVLCMFKICCKKRYLWKQCTVGIWIPSYFGIWMVEKRTDVKWSGFWMSFEYWTARPFEWWANGCHLIMSKCSAISAIKYILAKNSAIPCNDIIACFWCLPINFCCNYCVWNAIHWGLSVKSF